MMNNFTQVDPNIKNLYASELQPLPFGPSLVIRAFLVQRKQGNLLIYSTKNLESEYVQNLGGVERHYLNHGHEALFMSGEVAAPLYCHEKDSASVAKKTEVAETFSTQHKLGDDFEIIPTPGHTLGTTCYLWDNGSHRILFTGDMLHLHGDRWIVAILDSSGRSDYIKSLEHIRELDFDVLVPWAAQEEKAFYAETDKSDMQDRIDAILDRVRNGANY